MSDGDAIVLWGGVALIIIIFLPIVIAFWRRHPNRWLIFIVTVVFGATLIGWLIALVWSLNGFHRSDGETRDGGESGLNLFANDIKPVRVMAPSEPAGPSVPVPKDVGWAAEQLERLGKLRELGHIDVEEHARLKSEVLSRL